MTTTTQLRTIRQQVQAFEFKRLFNELGWDHYDQSLAVEVGGSPYPLTSVAEKRGMVVFVCAQSAGAGFPDRATRIKIEAQVKKVVPRASDHLCRRRADTAGVAVGAPRAWQAQRRTRAQVFSRAVWRESGAAAHHAR